jgi:hypothetical protein
MLSHCEVKLINMLLQNIFPYNEMHQKLLANTGYEKKGYGKVKRGWLE